LSKAEKEQFEQGYRELVLSELLIALMEEDTTSVRALARAARISPTIVQGLRSGSQTNVTLNNFMSILDSLGYSLIVEKRGPSGKKKRIVLQKQHALYSTNEKHRN